MPSTEKSGSYVRVVLKNTAPLFVQVNLDDLPFSAGSGIEDFEITPGENRIDSDLWEWLKENRSMIERRLEYGSLRESRLTKALANDMRGAADRGKIGMLCDKAKEIEDGEEFGPENATSVEGAIREVEDQLEAVKEKVPTIEV